MLSLKPGRKDGRSIAHVANARIAASLLLLAALTGWSCSREQRMRVPARSDAPVPVIVISIDTLRADHLPLYGYANVSTPAIDALAKDSVVFDNAYSHCPLTLPSHVTMLTGLLPAENLVRDNLGYRFDPKRFASIPTLLKQRGYATGAAVSAYVLRGNTGLRDAFDFYDDGISFQSGVALGDLARPGDETVASAERWVAQQQKPFFLFLHLFEPHTPYTPAEEFRQRYASNPYDGEIATADAIVGRFLDDLRKRKLYDNSLIILMSDHGEGLGDHGEQEHGIFLYREAIHVPLLLKMPSSQHKGTRVSVPVQLIDILPTVADLTRIETPRNAKGSSLVAEITKPQQRRIFSETMYPRIHLGLSDLRALIDSTYHFIGAPKPELYRVVSDPAEKANVIADERRVFAELNKELAGYDRALTAPSNISAEDARKLAALGYLGTASVSTAPSSRDPKDFIVEMESMKAATQLAAEGRLAEGISRLQGIVAKNPDYTDAWVQLATMLERAGRFDEAAGAYKRILTLVPAMTEETALSLASIYLNQTRLDDAKKHAELALHTNPGAAHLLLGRVALARRDYATAEQEARAATADDHYRIQGQVLLAQALTKTNRIPEALSLMDAAKAELESKHLQPVRLLDYARGDALVHLGRISEAEVAFRDEIHLFPDDRQTYVSLAALYFLQGHRDAARQVLVALTTANPDRESYRLAHMTTVAFGDAEGAAAWKRKLGADARQ